MSLHVQRTTSLLDSNSDSDSMRFDRRLPRVAEIREQFERSAPKSAPILRQKPPPVPIRSTGGLSGPPRTHSSPFQRTGPGGYRSTFSGRSSIREDEQQHQQQHEPRSPDKRVTFVGNGGVSSVRAMNGSTIVYPDGWHSNIKPRCSTPDPAQLKSWTPPKTYIVYSDIERSVDGSQPNQTSNRRVAPQAPSGGLKPSDWSDVDGGVNGRRARPVKQREEPRRHTVAGEALKSKISADSPNVNMDVERYNRNRKMTKSSSESGDPKKDIILGHLQRRFPEYASTIAGHKDQFATMPNPHHYESRDWPRIPMAHTHLYGQRGHSMYQPPSSVYDDDPGIMSEVETSATGFRRGGKQRSSLPVVRTPNKTLERPLVPSRGPSGYPTSGPPYKHSERPLGLVFLQYRSETKRALLPNEITSLDTVKALFVRSFSKQLTMEYLDSTHIRIYIHDPSKDMFYELEDLRDIRDRSVLRIYEQDMNGGGTPSNWDQDMSYFSEPEFDSDYQHQHIHRSKKSPAPPAGSYYGTMTTSYPPSLSVAHTATLPRSVTPMRSYSPAPGMLEKQKSQTLPPPGPIQPPPKPQRTYQQPVTSMAKSVRATPPPQGPPPPAPSPRSNQSMSDRRHQQTHESGYHSSPERRMADHHRTVPTYLTPTSSYEEPYYGDRGYGSRSGSVTPIIDEEARLRMQMMERQLANLTGLVHKALTTGRQPSITRDVELNLNREQIQLPSTATGPTVQTARESAAPVTAPTATPTTRTDDKTEAIDPNTCSASAPDELRSEAKPVLRQSSKEEKSVSFSEEPPSMSSPTHSKQHSPQLSVEKPTKSAIKPSSRQTSLTEVQLTPEMYNQLRLFKKRTKEMRLEVRNLRRMSQAQAINIKETIRETFLKIKVMLAAIQVNDQVQTERLRVTREEELYTQDVQRLEKDLSELESAVEELRSNVINRRCRVNMCDVESMALVLSRSSKTVADLKARFPSLQEGLKTVMTAEMEVVVKEEKFLKDEPERLENALRRCKKLTGTLVTLKRLASVQEQRLPPSGSGPLSPSLGEHRDHTLPHGGSLDAQMSKSNRRDWKWSTNFRENIDHWRGFSTSGWADKAASFSGELKSDGRTSRQENALDALLDELQTFATPDGLMMELSSSLSPLPVKRASSYSAPTDSPIKGQVISQGPAGIVSCVVPTSSISKLQVGEAGNRQSVDLSPSPSPSPVPEEIISKVSVQSDVVKKPACSAATPVSKKVPPPPPPRTSSKSPLTSPTSPASPSTNKPASGGNSGLRSSFSSRSSSYEPIAANQRPKSERLANGSDSTSSTLPRNFSTKKDPTMVLRTSAISDENLRREQLSSNSSSSESVNSQEGIQGRLGSGQGSALDWHLHLHHHHISSGAMSDSETIKKTPPPVPPNRNRKEILEEQHQKLLRKQRQLQEQYARLQQLQRGQTLQRFSPPRSSADLKKTGSESNILLKAGLSLTSASASASGSLTHLVPVGKTTSSSTATTNQVTSKIYETDIL